MKDIGKNIRQMRIARNMTQENLAEALFVTRQTVSNYETGKSRPDLDMLLQIAQILHTDVNSLIYGLPVPEDKRRFRNSAMLSGGVFLLLLLIYIILYPIFAEILSTRYFPVPLILLRLLIRPAMLFALGWFLLHIAGALCKFSSAKGRSVRVFRIVLYILTGAIVVISLPLVIWLMIGMVRSLCADSVSMQFPHIPVYYEVASGLVGVLLERPFALAILGAAWRLAGIPCARKAEETGSCSEPDA